MPGNPVLLVFKEVLPGDIRKHRAESNDAPTGGGAMDLRFRRANQMTPILNRMFPNPANEEGVASGTVHWLDDQERIHHAEIEFWRPTGVRPGEVRLGRIYQVDSWGVDEIAYRQSRQAGNKWFFLLVLDDERRVWARLQKQENLQYETAIVRNYIARRISETKGRKAVMGSLDFQTRTTFP